MDHPSRRRQWPTCPILFGVVLLVALTSPPARRRWSRPARRIQLAIASWVVLVLASATRPRAILLVAVVLATVGLPATGV
jgi:hypothetical protein